MPNSPLVSIRIPAETLERLDNLAQNLYPSRRRGKHPNRSQVILDAIEEYLANHEAETVDEPSLEEQVNQILQQYHKHLEQSIKEYIDEKFLAYAYNLENRLQTNRKLIQKTITH
ncbi:putative transcriptional regulator, CopG family [Gloeothece citriformis PCC 7424]|uniref:Putative transcriptional regulator, CopG family n=1 Tax=Gloeothece citriformis (strain PCC 7424) TaxID=65393 RepID=B7KL55_GLOC7|nr:ribbon-helix-helix domain-containing protein [Gloeothece citriformis]ACK72427.1 putative transcriptional regulator, CopG family [Gloeothece citriformis PCC 7424]